MDEHILEQHAFAHTQAQHMGAPPQTPPLTSCREEPSSAYAMHGTKAPYSPYSAAAQGASQSTCQPGCCTCKAGLPHVQSGLANAHTLHTHAEHEHVSSTTGMGAPLLPRLSHSMLLATAAQLHSQTAHPGAGRPAWRTTCPTARHNAQQIDGMKGRAQ